MFSKKYFYIVFLLVSLLVGCSNKGKREKPTSVDASNEKDSVFVSNNAEDERGYIVRVGDIAPDFLMNLPNGESVQLSALKGKVVMLQFTASWCGVCRKEMPYIEKYIWEKHKNNSAFALYGIDREEPVEKVMELIDKTGVSYPIGLDPNADIFKRYAEENAGITRNVIIDRDGKIVMLTRLFDMKEFNKMVEVIDKLLKEV